ncbi:MAG: lipid-A-disaccharide synthase [Chthoniobacterales bacterium]
MPHVVSRRLYLVAGEASGDTHGAALIAALHSLDPEMVFTGRGGPRMKAVAGGNFFDWSRHSAVLGLWEVLKKYRYFRRQFAASLRYIREERIEAVVLIDYPGFNLRLARALRRKMPDLKIIYYISPQVWAWNRRRIPKMAKWLDLMLCIFPFEADLYNQSGLRTVFVGHPMIEALGASGRTEERQPDLVALLAGSRWREVRKILPTMIRAAEHIRAAMPQMRFEVASASASFSKEVERRVRDSRLPEGSVQITIGQAEAAMQRASVGIIASGTATLQAAYFRLPFVLVYRVAWLTYLVARMVVKVKFLGMPNVLAGREVVREFIQHRADPRAIAMAALKLLQDQSARDALVAEFDQTIASLGEDGASLTAAQAIVEELG